MSYDKHNDKHDRRLNLFSLCTSYCQELHYVDILKGDKED